MWPAPTQMWHINIEVPPELFRHDQATEKRSYQYNKVYARKIFYHYLYFKSSSLSRQSPSTIKIIGLSYLASL